MANNTGNWVWSDEGLVAAPADGARRYLHRQSSTETVTASQRAHENALLLLVALLPLLLAAVTLVAG